MELSPGCGHYFLMPEMSMNKESFYRSMLRDLRSIKMNQHQRTRAEEGVRQSAAIVELLLGVAGYFGAREQQVNKAS